MKKISIYILLLFSFIFTLIFIPKNDNYNYVLEYASSDIEQIPIYLLDNNNYVAKTNIGLNCKNIDDKIVDLVNVLIIGGPKEDQIPNGFKSVINENTILLSHDLKDNVLKLNFSSSLLEDNEVKVIESIVYTMTELDEVDKIIIYIDGKLLTKLKNGDLVNSPLDREIGINKVYNIDDLNNINKVTIYYTNTFNDQTYYVPVTKYLNDTREKITIIIDELNSTSLYTTNLMSFLNQDVKLINSIEENNNLTLEFNDSILNSENIIADEVIYTILYSIKDNYDVKNVTFLVENEEILKKVLKS